MEASVIPAVLMFVATVGIFMGAYWLLILRPEAEAAGTVRKRLKGTPRQRVLTSAKNLLKRDEDFSNLGFLDTFLRRAEKISSPLQNLIEQADVRLTVGTFLLASACAGLLAFVVVQFLIHLSAAALVVAVVAAMAPYGVLRFKRSRRISQFEEQFPEALDFLARSLKAGHAFTTGISLVAEEMPTPVGPEFQLLYDRQNYGMPFPDALRDFGQRIPIIDAKFFVTAVLIQREAGGNLSEILMNLSGVIRERFRVKRQVRVLSAHGRITGMVLSGLPPTLAVVMLIISENHIQTLLGSPTGHQMIFAAIVLQVVGTLIIRKICNIEY